MLMTRVPKSARGSSLGLVLAVAALAMLAAFTAANVSTVNLRMSSKVANSQIAENLAESVVQEALANLQSDFGFVDSIEVGPGLGLPPGSRGTLTFDSSVSGPYSSNNFLGENPNGWNRAVPDQTVHLVGLGESGGVTRHVEVVAYLPSFPVTMACDGPVVVKNSLIGGFDPKDDRTWKPGSGYEVDEDELTPGHLVSNAQGRSSVLLDRKTKVTGDIQSRGDVSLEGATVEGEIRSNWGQRAPLPNFKLNEFDPAENKNTYYEELGSARRALNLTGNVRYEGDLALSGELFLDNAFLFVDGNLTVDGPVKGVGAIVALGDVSFKGSTDITSNEQVAVLSGGGLTISGSNSLRSVFRGLLYSKGDFKATKITVVGGFIVDRGSKTDIIDSQVFFSGQSINPRMKKEVFSVVPRFTVPDPNSRSENLVRDDLGFPTGTWKERKRNVSNVINRSDPDWCRSGWEMDDPAVIRVVWVNDQPQYTYEYWGRSSGGPVFNRSGPAPKDNLAKEMARVNTAPNVHKHLNGTPPNAAAYEQYLLEVMNHLEQDALAVDGFNFSLDPNEFITDSDEIRVLLHKSY
jgi:hypothetical protein